MTLPRILALPLSAVLLVVLWACAAPPHSLPQIATGAPSPGKAIVIVSVSHDAQAGSGAVGGVSLDRATPQVMLLDSATARGKPPVTNDLAGSVGHVYALEVTPGHHQFSVWCMTVRERYGCSTLDLEPLGFDVAAGEILYLGNLDIRLHMGQTWLTHKEVATAAYAEVLDRTQRDIAIAERRNPAIAGKVRVALLRLGPWKRIEAAPGAAPAANQPAGAGDQPASAG